MFHVIGRRWFQRSYGNTYHTVEIRRDGVTVWKSEKAYGYDRQFLQTAAEWFKKNGYPNVGGHSQSIREIVGATYSVFDVSRERDL